ncbi:MAG: RNA polymerase sigma factor [candidate division Zixibacteria bacterium]|nr:RNA polymerase sigma factor [candidate division Zixibacteria bacterium]
MSGNLFWKLLESEHPKAEAFSRKLAGNREDGDDLYQDALVKAWRKFDNLRDVDSFRPWLYRIIVNMYKSRRRMRWLKSRVNLSRDSFENAESYDPSSKYAARLWLERAFRSLSADQKALIGLFELEGWSITDLARMYGKPEGTIKSRLSRARGKMRAELALYFPDGKEVNLNKEADYALPRSKTSTE